MRCEYWICYFTQNAFGVLDIISQQNWGFVQNKARIYQQNTNSIWYHVKDWKSLKSLYSARKMDENIKW